MDYPLFPKKSDPEYKIHRRFEVIPGLLTWSTFISIFVLSFFLPVAAAIIIIIYDLFWLTKTLILSVHTIIAYRRMKKAVNLDWLKKCEKLNQRLKNQTDSEKDNLPPRLEDIYHLIVIPFYTEGIEILEPAIQSLVATNYPKDKIIIVMGAEARGGKQALKRQKIIKQKYGHSFKAFLTTVHPDDPTEMKLKANNTNWAIKKALIYLKNNNIPFKNVLVSNFDCDTCVHKEYFGAVTYHFLKSKKRYRQSYQPLPYYHNNIWDTNAIVRVIASGSSFWHMIESTRPERLVTFSSHSMTLPALIDVGFWKKDVISEDSGIFWQCLTHYNGDYRVVPLHIPVSMDATLSSSFLKTVANQYRQKRRWAYGIEHFARVCRAFRSNKKIPFRDKFHYLFTMLEGHYSWATASFVILFLGWLPLIVGNQQFQETVLAHNLPLITRTILTIAMLGLSLTMLLTFMLLPPKPAKYSNFKYLALVLQWILVPIIAPLVSAPAIDSQTRLLFKKYFKQFWVSEKIRKD